MTLKDLYKIILNRKKSPSENSYVSSLFKSGIDRISQKVGEEAIETVVAAKNKNNQRLIEEVADLWFHSLVLLAEKKITPEKIMEELEKRHQLKLKKSVQTS